MTKKIFKNIFLVSLLTLIACLALLMGVLFKYFEERISMELESQSLYISQGIEKSGHSYFDGLNKNSNRVTWIDFDGTVLYDSNADVSSMENHLNREEVEEALLHGTGKAVRYSRTLSEKTIYYAVLLKDNTVIRVSSTQSTAWSMVKGMLPSILLILLITIIISIGLASKMAKKIIKPINNIDLESPDIHENYHELSPLLNKINRQNAFIKKQMQDLQSKQKEFQIITENMAEGFIIVDRKTDIISYNQSALKLLGSKILEKNKSVLSLNRSESFRLAVDAGLSGKHSEQLLEIGDCLYRIFANPVYNENEVTGVVIIILDVTEKEQREILRREFTSNVSHELKTPLTSIYGISEIMMNGIMKADDITNFAKNIHDETGRLIALIEDIIKLSQLDENLVPAVKEQVDLYGIAKSVIERLDAAASLKGVTVALEGDPVKVSGIPSLIDEMIYNLCDNAIKYNKENGKVKVTISENNGHASLSVSDTGIGIPAKDLNRVFERFYRVDKSHSKKIGGTGLGLSIVKHGAAFHGATVKLESTENVGTTVTINF